MAAFYLDQDAPEALASLLSSYGHAATTTRAEDRKGRPDYDQLCCPGLPLDEIQ